MDYIDDKGMQKKMSELALKVKVHETLKNMLQECITDMVNIGIPVQIEKIEGIYLGNIKNAFAVCRYDKNSDGGTDFNIVITNKIIKHMNDEIVIANVKNSIYHELIHTCSNCQNGHNATWLEYAVISDNKLNIRTRSRQDEKVYLNRAKGEIYTYNCENCGFEYQTVDNTISEVCCPICKKTIYKKQN